MAHTRTSGIVGFDADAAVEAARGAAGDGLRIASEYDMDGYRLLYVADSVIEEYGSTDPIEDAGDRLHSYIHLDFTERELFEEIAADAGQVTAYVTRMEHHTLIRYLDEREGLFLSVETGTALTPLLEAVEAAVE